MSIYTTPLQFGYFMALLFAVLFWIRGSREERLADTLMGWLMLLLNQMLQDYTFGFAGINVLWNELHGFPRGAGLLLGPAVYFYLRTQTNRNFKLQRKHLWHLLPWAVMFVYQLQFFLRGPLVVQAYEQSSVAEVMNAFSTVLLWASLIAYFRASILLYRRYRGWIAHAYSDLDRVSLAWFRNFIYVYIAGFAFQQVMMLVDVFADWDFYQDWWWNLALVGVVAYTAIQGYAQPQMVPLAFDDAPEPTPTDQTPAPAAPTVDSALQLSIETAMQQQQLYLESDLTLASLAKRINAPSSAVSATINTAFQCNFNEFVNRYRIQYFKQELARPENQQLTLLAVAFDSGFNSKATFNRVFKRLEGMTPKAYWDSLRG